MKEIGEMWRSLPGNEKAVYEKKAKLDKDRYDAEMAALPMGA